MSMQDVEAELLSGAEGAQHLVMLAAMAQAEIDDLAATAFARACTACANLPVGIVAVLVEQSGCQLDFERLFIEQIDDWRGDGASGSSPSTRAAAWRSSRRVSIS